MGGSGDEEQRESDYGVWRFLHLRLPVFEKDSGKRGGLGGWEALQMETQKKA